jgi:tetratricopeptide (TPR) repeat protein
MAEAHYNLGHLLHHAGRIEEAVACYRRALASHPVFAAAHNNLANALKASGRVDEALVHYAEAVRADPRLAGALSNYGTTLRELKRYQEAVPLLERAAQLQPGDAAVLNNLGIAYHELKADDRAVACYRRALELDPGYYDALTNLGNALNALGEAEEAIAAFRSAIALAPAQPNAHSNMGVVLQERGEAQAAMASYRRALELAPDHADALSNMGYLLQEQGRMEEAMEYYRRAVEADRGLARAAYNLGLGLIVRGELAQGWELHERRFDTVPPIALRRGFDVPAFTPADFGTGQRVAVWAEQGVGDQILYSTLVPEMIARGASAVLEVDPRLLAAFRRAHPDWSLTTPRESQAAFAGCTREIALGSLPRLLRPTRESFAAQPRALLAADPSRAGQYRERLAAPGVKTIAISWRSFQPKARAYLQRKKSSHLEAFAALARREDLRLVDLQYGDTAAEREAFARAGGRLTRLDELDLFNDLDGVLAAIEACDLVLTTSNVTAHFAGALGKRTLLVYLAGNPPFHYWAAGAEGRSLWYPSVEIVTAPELDAWEKVFARAAERLGD